MGEGVEVPNEVPMEAAVEEETEGKGVLEKVGTSSVRYLEATAGTMLQALGAAASEEQRRSHGSNACSFIHQPYTTCRVQVICS